MTTPTDDVVCVFFFHDAKIATLSFGLGRDEFLRRLVAGESFPLPAGAIGLVATYLRIESGGDLLFAITLDTLDCKLGALRFSSKPF